MNPSKIDFLWCCTRRHSHQSNTTAIMIEGHRILQSSSLYVGPITAVIMIEGSSILLSSSVHDSGVELDSDTGITSRVSHTFVAYVVYDNVT